MKGVFQLNFDLKPRKPEVSSGASGWALYLPFCVVRYFAHEDNDSLDIMLFHMLQTQNLKHDGRLLVLPKVQGNQGYVVVTTENQQKMH